MTKQIFFIYSVIIIITVNVCYPALIQFDIDLQQIARNQKISADCAICLEDLSQLDIDNPLKFPCGHIFHEECLKNYIDATIVNTYQKAFDEELERLNKEYIERADIQKLISEHENPEEYKKKLINEYEKTFDLEEIRADIKHRHRDMLKNFAFDKFITGFLKNKMIRCPLCRASFIYENFPQPVKDLIENYKKIFKAELSQPRRQSLVFLQKEITKSTNEREKTMLQKRINSLEKEIKNSDQETQTILKEISSRGFAIIAHTLGQLRQEILS
jgi:hypothetical protein